jgi:hypothetical protein
VKGTQSRLTCNGLGLLSTPQGLAPRSSTFRMRSSPPPRIYCKIIMSLICLLTVCYHTDIVKCVSNAVVIDQKRSRSQDSGYIHCHRSIPTGYELAMPDTAEHNKRQHSWKFLIRADYLFSIV